jgi:hypothetical protein
VYPRMPGGTGGNMARPTFAGAVAVGAVSAAAAEGGGGCSAAGPGASGSTAV